MDKERGFEEEEDEEGKKAGEIEVIEVIEVSGMQPMRSEVATIDDYQKWWSWV